MSLISVIKYNKKRFDNNIESELNKECYFQLAEIISSNDEIVLSLLEEGIGAPVEFFNKHLKKDEKFLNIKHNDIYILRWLNLIFILEENGYVCRIEHSADLNEFILRLKTLKNYPGVNVLWFNEHQEVVNWCSVFDERYKNRDLCIIALDINRVDAVIFIQEKQKLKQIIELVKTLNQRTALGSLINYYL